MHTRRLLIIVLIFVGLTQLFYMVSNAAMFRSEYQRQNLEQMEELGQIIKKEVEFALDLGLPLGSIGGMDTFLSSVLETAPELSHIHVASGSVVLFSAHRAMDAVQDIRIPILSQDRQVGEIRLGLGDALGKRTYTLLFDLLTIVMAGLIITYEVIRFFGSRLMVIPLKQSKENINAMVRDLTPVPPMRVARMSMSSPTSRPPEPIGPNNPLWPVKVSTSMWAACMSIGSTPALWQVSMTNTASESATTLPMASMSCTAPITLEAWLTITTLVRGVMALRMSSGSR